MLGDRLTYTGLDNLWKLKIAKLQEISSVGSTPLNPNNFRSSGGLPKPPKLPAIAARPTTANIPQVSPTKRVINIGKVADSVATNYLNNHPRAAGAMRGAIEAIGGVTPPSIAGVGAGALSGAIGAAPTGSKALRILGGFLGAASKVAELQKLAAIKMAEDARLQAAGVSGYNQPKRTPGHPTKSHIVVAKDGDQVKTIRFGQQGVKTNQTAGQRKAFKSRHAKNIAKGRMSAAYWANKVKWSPSKTKDKDNDHWVKGSSYIPTTPYTEKDINGHTFSSRGKTWQVARLHQRAAELNPYEVPLEQFDQTLGSSPWGQVSLRNFVDHMNRVSKADLNYPIILSDEGRVMDGMHRLARALQLGRKRILAVRFPVTPEPDMEKEAEARRSSMLGSRLTRDGIEFIKLAMARVTIVPGVNHAGHVAERLAGRFGMSSGQVRRSEDLMANTFKRVAPDAYLGDGGFYQKVSIGPPGQKQHVATIVMNQIEGAKSHSVNTLLSPNMAPGSKLKPMAESLLTKEQRRELTDRLNQGFGNIIRNTK